VSLSDDLAWTIWNTQEGLWRLFLSCGHVNIVELLSVKITICQLLSPKHRRDPWEWQWTNRHIMDHYYPSMRCNLSYIDIWLRKTCMLMKQNNEQKLYIFLDKGWTSSGLYVQGLTSQLLQSFNTRTIEQNQSQTRENETKANDNCASTLLALVPELPTQSLCSARRVCSWPARYAAAAPRNVTNTFPWK